jgi:vacuolar iron transporter family protein
VNLRHNTHLVARRPRPDGASYALFRRYLPDLVFGANDGIITTFAVVSGVVGASLSNQVILILGFANLIADGVSMGASNYLSRRSDPAAGDPGRRQPARHGLATLVGFVTAGIVPLAAYLLPLEDGARYPTAIGLTLASLFVVGATRSLVTRARFARSGLEMLLVGSIAAGIAYGIGALASALTGGDAGL